jgi:hypothetical protein
VTKWADYGICRVKYNHGHTAIVELEVRADSGTSIGEPQRFARQSIVDAIERGTTFVTIYARDAQWTRGEDVRVVLIVTEKYLRTDRNALRADNLGSLPEYV